MSYCNHSIQDFQKIFRQVDSDSILDILAKNSSVQLGAIIENAALQTLWERNTEQVYTSQDYINALCSDMPDDSLVRALISQEPKDSLSFKRIRILLSLWQSTHNSLIVKAVKAPKEQFSEL